jgi:hypothetical protein
MTRLILLAGAVFAAACTTTSSPAPGPGITLLAPSNDPVNGNTFRCLGHWPSAMNPCTAPGGASASSATTFATDDQGGIVDLELSRTPIPIDGGNSTVHIQLTFDAGLSVDAFEHTTRAGDVATIETSEVVSGWIQPEVLSDSAAARNAGRFDLAFSWGEIVGQYDTNPLQP